MYKKESVGEATRARAQGGWGWGHSAGHMLYHFILIVQYHTHKSGGVKFGHPNHIVPHNLFTQSQSPSIHTTNNKS